MLVIAMKIFTIYIHLSKHCNIMPTLLIYPIKYLNATLLPYGSLIDKTILLISTL